VKWLWLVFGFFFFGFFFVGFWWCVGGFVYFSVWVGFIFMMVVMFDFFFFCCCCWECLMACFLFVCFVCGYVVVFEGFFL